MAAGLRLGQPELDVAAQRGTAGRISQLHSSRRLLLTRLGVIACLLNAAKDFAHLELLGLLHLLQERQWQRRQGRHPEGGRRLSPRGTLQQSRVNLAGPADVN